MANLTIFLLRGIILFMSFLNVVSIIRPVVLMHGVTAGSGSLIFLGARIQQMHPGTRIYNIARYSYWGSLDPMWTQVDEIGRDIMNFSANYPDGINMIGYSQGALITRAILQRYPQHNVRTFISLAGPQAGQYGKPLLNVLFPGLTVTMAYEYFYTPQGQQNAVGNYWKDPYHLDLYLKNSVFLPYVNNEKLSLNSTEFKNGITKLNQMVLIGGPDDGIISPWQSSHFGYWDNDTVVDIEDQDIYKKDAIGLKTLYDTGRLDIYSIPGVNHSNWVLNVTVIDNYILPYLN